MFRWVGGIFDRIFAVLGALLMAQAPLFITQYTQQLGGHASELKYQIEIMRSAASQSGKTLDQVVDKFLESKDSDFSKHGEIIHEMIIRQSSLSEGVSALTTASVFIRPFVFIKTLNYDIAKTTLSSFELGIPLTYEGGIYALVGILIGFAVFYLCHKTIRFFFSIIFRRFLVS